MRDLDWIVDEDFWTLKASLPIPAHRSQPMGPHIAQTSFGHQAADASDTCQEIAWVLNGIEAALRSLLGDTPALSLVRTCGSSLVRTSESLLVEHAYKYLCSHDRQLCDWPDVGYHAGALHDTHQTNRRVYGLTRRVEHLALLCPDCDLAVLVRDIGRVHTSGEPSRTRITCENCGLSISEEEYSRKAYMDIASATRVYEAEH